MYKAFPLRLLVLCCLLLAVACAPAAPKATTPVSDHELNAAIEEARGSLDTLLRAMIAPKESYEFLGIKIRFNTQDGAYDDNWVEPVDYYDGIFTIRMMDGLSYNTNLHVDHTLDVPLKKVVDWVIVEKDGTIIGGYTIRLAYEHMSQPERDEFIRVTGYKIK